MGLVVTTLMVIPSCGSLPFNLLTGGGPNVAANTQVGETNSQTVGTTEIAPVSVEGDTIKDVKVSKDKTTVKSEQVDKVQITNTTDPKTFALLLALFIAWSYLLWKLPSPDQIWKTKNK